MSNQPTDLQAAVVRGDQLATEYQALTGDDYGAELCDLVVDAISDLLHFLRSEEGPTAHYAAAQRAVMDVDSEVELHTLSDAPQSFYEDLDTEGNPA